MRKHLSERYGIISYELLYKTMRQTNYTNITKNPRQAKYKTKADSHNYYHIKTIPKLYQQNIPNHSPYQHHTRTYQHPTRTIPKPYQNNTKTVPKPYHNIPKPYQAIPKPYQAIPKPYQNHTQAIHKQYQNHTNTSSRHHPNII